MCLHKGVCGFVQLLVFTWRKNPIALSVRPANDLSHLFECQLLHQHKNRGDLISKPGAEK